MVVFFCLGSFLFSVLILYILFVLSLSLSLCICPQVIFFFNCVKLIVTSAYAIMFKACVSLIGVESAIKSHQPTLMRLIFCVCWIWFCCVCRRVRLTRMRLKRKMNWNVLPSPTDEQWTAAV